MKKKCEKRVEKEKKKEKRAAESSKKKECESRTTGIYSYRYRISRAHAVAFTHGGASCKKRVNFHSLSAIDLNVK